ncbi:MAG: glycosyltransferase family 1 protein, partial [Myxococcaceae bacterium]|nr:glycosyltransferase family 1 protein [Myxococcaceae bacterium]
MARLVFVVNNPDFLVSHRLVLVRGAIAAGYEVHAIAPEGAGVAALEREGVVSHRWQLDRKSQGPLVEARSLAALVALYVRLAPDVVHHVTIKPVLYGSAAARLVRRPAVVNAVSGFGYVFLASGTRAFMRRRAVSLAYRVALSTPRSVVVLQNDDDEADLRRAGALGNAEVVKIRGSGVDLARFSPTPPPAGPPLIVLPARLLRDKGVVEFVEAARRVRALRPAVRFALVGGLDPGNPAAISADELSAWVREGVVEAWGH